MDLWRYLLIQVVTIFFNSNLLSYSSPVSRNSGISVITQPADEEQELTVMDRISEANKRKNEE